MSNKRTEAGRKAKRKKVAKVAKAQEKASKAAKGPAKRKQPGPDLAKQKASLQHLENLRRHLVANAAKLKQEVTQNLTQTHQNHVELQQGLDASEYNLRAHQKVLNSMAIEIEKIVAMLNDLGAYVPDWDGKERLEFSDLKMKDVALDKGTTVRRVDWPFYHQQVDKDLAILAQYEEERRKEQEEQERQARVAAAKEAEEKKQAIVRACDRLRNTCSELSLRDLANRIESGEQILKDENLKEFDLDAASRKLAVSRLREKTQEEAPQEAEPPPEKIGEFPDLATTFGGDYGTEEASNNKDPQEGSGGEHRPPGEREEDAVSEV